MVCLCANADGKAHTIRSDKDIDSDCRYMRGMENNNRKLLEGVGHE